MAVKFLDNTGLGYFWGKIKAWCNSTFAAIAHTHSSTSLENTKHSYTTAANAAKNWYRIANANISQIDPDKPLHLQFFVRAQAQAAGVAYWQSWFVDLEVWGQYSGARIFGNTNAPFSQIRILYENTAANVTSSTSPSVDLYLNYVLAGGTVIEIEEVYNSGFTFIANGVLAASTVPSGYESRTMQAYASGVNNCGTADYATYHYLYGYNISANTTLSSSNSNHRYRILNCTGTITLTVPSWNSSSGWFFIKNNGSGVVTVHPASTSVMFDNVSTDITLQPGEFIRLVCQSNNHYSIVDDGRWKSQKMMRGSYERIQGTSSEHKDLNDYIDAGFYNIKTQYVDNCPTGIGVDAVLLVYPWNQGLYCTQELTESAASGDARRWIRKLNSSTWSVWKQVAFTNTTLAGYGITDAKIANGTITLGSNSITPLTSHQTLPTLSRTISGSGNAITDITVSNHAITATKGSSFALDSNVVHTTGNETISGTKSFSTGLACNERGVFFAINNPHIAKGDSPTITNYHTLVFYDKNGNASTNRFGFIENFVEQGTGKVCTKLGAYKNVANSDDYTELCLWHWPDGTSYATCPTPPDSSNNTTIATTKWVKDRGYLTSHQTLPTLSLTTSGNGNAITALSVSNHAITATKGTTFLTSHQSLANYVTLNGVQTISGQKTFSSNAITTGRWCCNREDPTLQLNLTEYTKGDTLTASTNAGIFVHDKTADTMESTRLGFLRHYIDVNRNSGMQIVAYKNIQGSTDTAALSIIYEYGGSKYATCPTPADNDNSVKIATTAWVQKFCGTTKGYITASSNITGTAANVTGTVAIANGGTGATTRLNAVKALTNENVGSAANHFLTITSSWGKAGYTSVADAKTVLGLKSAAYTESSDYATSGHTHNYVPLSGGTMTGSLTQKHTGLVKGSDVSAWTCRDYRVIDNSGDSGDKPCLSWWRTAVGIDKTVSIELRAFKFADESTDNAGLTIVYPVSGDPYISGITPATSDNSTKIATTAYVKAQNYITSSSNITGTAANVTGIVAVANGGTGSSTKNFVDLSNAQTVGGTKTFSSNVKISKSGSAMFFSTSTGNATEANNWECLIGVGASGSGGLFDSTRGYYILERTPVTGIVTIIAKKDDKSATGTYVFNTNGEFSLTGNAKLNSTSTTGIYKSNATSLAEYSGGSALNKGARLALYGESHATYAGRFDLIAANASTSKSLVGKPDGTLTWGGQSVSTSSDERIKTKLQTVPENILNAWEDVEWGEFKFLEAVADKGESARFHTGLIAQAVDRTFKAKNLDACKYGILCHEERGATEDEPAVDMWTVRYTEALAMEAAYQRRKNKILENRISELENQLSSVLQTLKELKGVG